MMIRLILAALVLRLVWWFVARQMRAAAAPPPRKQAGPGGPSVPLVRDPVCGTFVEPARAVEARDGSTTHYFCSETCRSRFRDEAGRA